MSTASATPNWSLFDQNLQQDIAHSEQLLDVLRDERKALESRAYGDLESLIAQKKIHLEKLESNADKRRRWLAQHGLGDDLTALEAVRREAPTVAERWQAAAATWRECQNESQINEQICRRTRLVVERVLDIVRGQNANSTTYNASGYSQRSEGGRTITSA